MLSTPSPFLRQVLLADALISGVTGLAMMLGAGLLADLLGLPAMLLRWAGLILLPFAALVGWLATRERLPSRAVWAVITLNALWAADCVLLVVAGLIEPTWLGLAFVLFQAAVVALFAELQYVGLRRSTPAPA